MAAEHNISARYEAREKALREQEQSQRANELRLSNALSLTASLEALLTSRDGFGLTTASPLQRALCGAADGLGVALEGLPEAILRFGGEVPPIRPELVVVVAGIRGGKSLIAGAAAFRSACVADLSGTMPHEIVRVSVLAPTVRLAKKTFRLLTGAILSSAALSAIAPPDEWTADTIKLIRPSDGRIVEITVIAADPMGMSLRSDWCAGYVFDEVALFGSEASGAAVNAEELLRAAKSRLLPGAQGWLISSPYGPEGLLYRLWKEHFGKPMADEERALVVRAPTRALNPAFPQSKIDRVRAREPDVAAREYDAEFVDADTAFFSSPHIDAARCDVEPPRASAVYVAAWDAATRGNAWTLAIGRREGDALVVAQSREWVGSKQTPLDPEDVIREIAVELAPYRVTTVHGDEWSADALRALARARGLTLVSHASPAGVTMKAAKKLDAMLRGSRARFGGDVERLTADLRAVRKRGLANAVRVELPRTADGRHCDYAPAVFTLVNELFPGEDRDEGAMTGEQVAGLVGEAEMDPAVARVLEGIGGEE